MTDSATPPDESPEAFGAALATVAGVELRAEGLTPPELNEIGRRAAEAIRDAARELPERHVGRQQAYLVQGSDPVLCRDPAALAAERG